MGPIDYNIQVADPLQGLAQGFQLGAGLRQVQRQRALQDQYKADLQSYVSNPTAQGAAALALKYPQQREAVKQSWDTLAEAERADQGKAAGQLYAALNAGRDDIAKTVVQRRIDALKNSKKDASAEENILEMINRNPASAKAAVGLVLAQTGDAKAFATQYAALAKNDREAAMFPFDQQKAQADIAGTQANTQKTQAEAGIKSIEQQFAPQVVQQGIRKTEADISNLQSQIFDRSARLGLDQDRLTTETQTKLAELQQKFGELPADATKNLNEAATQATASEQAASQSLSLASRLDQSGVGYGSFASASEFLKRATGNQDALSALRQEYTRVRAQGVLKLLPPGPATDKDVALAMEGFPPPTADARQLASFLRGMAKLQTYDATLNNAKAQWFGEVRNLGAAKRDLVIDGVQVPAGTTFNDFARQAVAKKARENSAASFVDGLAAKYGNPQSGGASGGY